MFDDLVECSPTPKKTSKRWTVIVSAVVQCAVLAVLVLIPLIYTDTLEGRMLSTLLVAPAPPPPPPPPAAPVQKVIVKPVARLIQAGKLMAPKAIPKDVKIIKEEEMPPDVNVGVTGGVPGGVPGGQAGGVIGGIIGGVVGNAPPPPRPQQRIRQGGQVTAANIISRTQPQYPPLARQARVSGTVKLHAIIAKDGTVQELQVMGGHPLLIQAALDAVRQWRYRPTLLNGEPVEVDTTIDVIFTLN
jgi:protein TonB